VQYQELLRIPSTGRGLTEITGAADHFVGAQGVSTGLLCFFVRHTSASLIICENSDPQVLADLEAWFARAVPDGDPLYGHVAEGPDDMPAHVRAVLTQASICVPVSEGKCALGTWQGVFLFEHRRAPQRRQIRLTLMAS